MNLEKISSGKNVPEEINVIIEIPMNSDPVKYEFDKETGAIFVDRFIPVSMSYPCNYGFIPHTLGGDGDPMDVLVISQYPVSSGAVIKCRPIGVIMMEDESGIDEKILAVPTVKLDPSMENIKDISDVNEFLIKKINHFFERYKDLEKGKWVKIASIENAEKAKSVILESIKNAG